MFDVVVQFTRQTESIVRELQPAAVDINETDH